MSSLTTYKIRNLKNFTHLIESFSSNSNSLWYRGCGKASYNLVPTLYRHPCIQDVKELLDLESQIIARFKQRSVPYLTRTHIDWEYLFLMQHFGVPTRLLDWTESPYISLYFALTFACKKPNNTYAENASIWVLDPIKWNTFALKHIGFNKGILSTSDQILRGYAPEADITLMNSEPVAIYGTYNSPRIVAQRGVFTIFGKSMDPMEEIYINRKFPENSLMKIIVPANRIPELLKSVISIGFSDSVIFPDLDGLAKEIKRFFNFEV